MSCHKFTFNEEPQIAVLLLVSCEFRVNTDKKKELLANKQNEIQEKIKDAFGHVPRNGSFATSNDGNAARQALRSHETFAKILRVDVISFSNSTLSFVSCSLKIQIKVYYIAMIPSRHITQYEWYSIPGGVNKSSQTFTLGVNPINTLQTCFTE